MQEFKIQGILCHWFCTDPQHEAGLGRIGWFKLTAKNQEGQELRDILVEKSKLVPPKEVILL